VTFGTNAFNLGSAVISGGTWQGGTIQPAYGGTGLTTFAGANNALYSTGSTTLTAGTLPPAAGGTGLTTFTGANNALYSTGAATLTAGTLPIAAGGTGQTTANTAFNALAPSQTSNSGKYLTTDGSNTSWGTVGGEFPSGTAMLFVQTSAPTGWTKSTTHDNKALRVVSGSAGSGGSAAFTTAFGTPTVSGSVTLSGTVGSTTLTTTQIPSHTHNINKKADEYGGGNTAAVGANAVSSVSTSATGGGGSHNHSFSGSGSLSSATAAINVFYVDVIIATKD
jgi:hypothetical protein